MKRLFSIKSFLGCQKNLLKTTSFRRDNPTSIYWLYNGIGSILFLNHHRTLIRDSLMRTDKERIQAGPARKEAGITKGDYRPVISWQLLARHWKLALDDAVGGIKAEWSNTKNRVRDVIRNHAE